MEREDLIEDDPETGRMAWPEWYFEEPMVRRGSSLMMVDAVDRGKRLEPHKQSE